MQMKYDKNNYVNGHTQALLKIVLTCGNLLNYCIACHTIVIQMYDKRQQHYINIKSLVRQMSYILSYKQEVKKTMNEKITFRLNSAYADKINQMKNKSEFLNNLIENYYSSEKKSNDDIIVKLTEKISELENNIVKNNLEFEKKFKAYEKNLFQIDKEIVNMLMQTSYSTQDNTTIKNNEKSFDNLENFLKIDIF